MAATTTSSSTISASTLAENNTRESCWLAINNTVWDVTSFLSQHPGGSNVILKLAGQDATASYETFHDAELVEKTLPLESRKGRIDSSAIASIKSEKEQPEEHRSLVAKNQRRPLLNSMLNLSDFQILAQKFMTPLAWAYISSGADDEFTMNANASAYGRVLLRGRILRKINDVDLTTTILGHKSTLPVYTSPVGLGKLVHPDGECCIARADGAEGIIQVVNTVSSQPIEKIMAARVSEDQPVFWQLYLDKDLEKSRAFVERVEKCGVKAIWLTVDSPVTGNRERDERLKLEEGEGEEEEDLDSVVSNSQTGGSGIAASNNSFINGGVDWDILTWLRTVTKLPIVIKGIGCVEDAVAAYTHGADGIVLSNHGGRSQDTSQPPLLTLLEIRTYAPHLIASKKFQIFVDGGVRRGTDVLKALCLGADAVGIGRPVLYSMAAGFGHYGIRRMIQILKREMATNMAFLGARRIEDLRAEMLNTRRLENMMMSSANL